MAEGDEWLSVFVGEYTRLADARARMAELEAALAMRASLDEPPPFKEGDHVWVKWDRCADGKVRRAHGVVEALHADGRMCVGWPDEAGCATTFPASAWAPMAHAGALSSVPAELCGAALVGRRIRVYWPGMDAMYGARVTAWHADKCAHAAKYDDGEVLCEALAWSDGRPGFVLDAGSLEL